MGPLDPPPHTFTALMSCTPPPDLDSAFLIKLVSQFATDALHRRSKCSQVINRLMLASSLPTLLTATIPSCTGGATCGARGVCIIRELTRKEEDEEVMLLIFAEEQGKDQRQ
jgi:hypothetical protein